MRSVLFVTIVWTVAASFVAFEELAMWGTDLIANEAGLSRLALPQAIQSSTSCEAPTRADTEPPAAADYYGWRLGLALGLDASHRQRLGPLDARLSGAVDAELDRSAAALSAPRPGPFTARQRAMAHTEFVSFVEADPSATARFLASHHSVRACHLYKLGAYWGYSALVLAQLPDEPANYALELRHYAALAGLPERLYLPMVSPVDGLRARDTSGEVTQELAARAGVDVTSGPTAR